MDVETESAMAHSHLPTSLTLDSQRERATQLYAAALFKLLAMDGPSARTAPALAAPGSCVRPIVYAEVCSDGSKQQVALQLPSRGDHRYSAEQWAHAELEGGGGGLHWVEQHVRDWASSNRPARCVRIQNTEESRLSKRLANFRLLSASTAS